MVRIAPFKMLPSGNRRAICDVTFCGPWGRGGLPREPGSEVGILESDLSALPASRAPGKHRMLTEFCAVTSYHRKYAVRLLNGPAPTATRLARPRHRRSTYGPAVIDALTTIWTAAGYPWSVRLKALLPLWLPWARRRLRLAPAA